MRRIYYGLIVLYLIAIQCIAAAVATPPSVKEGTVNIANVDTAINLSGTFNHIIIKTSTTAAIVYVNLNNTTATTSDFQIDPGAGLTTERMAPGISGFHYIGASATGTLSYQAW